MVVKLLIRRKLGPKGQIVIPKIIREYLGFESDTEVLMEVKEGGLVIKKRLDPTEFVEEFVSVSRQKLKKETDLEKIIGEEIESRTILH